MKKRNFFKSILAFALCPFLPKLKPVKQSVPEAACSNSLDYVTRSEYLSLPLLNWLPPVKSVKDLTFGDEAFGVYVEDEDSIVYWDQKKIVHHYLSPPNLTRVYSRDYIDKIFPILKDAGVDKMTPKQVSDWFCGAS